MLLTRTRKSLFRRNMDRLHASLKYLVFLALFSGSMIAVGVSSLVPHYDQVEDEIIALADAHLRYELIHPGWSFPGRVWSAPASLDLPLEQLLVHARIRGYEEICPARLPGQICPDTGEVVLRGGTFPEGMQPDSTGNWTRERALEPVLIGWLVGDNGEIREHLPIEEAPQRLLSAIIAAEDDTFYEHVGVNPRGALRALLANIRGGGFDQGASTITMQVVRAITQEREKTLARKFREAAAAVALDAHLEKDEILQIYLDAPYLGQYDSYSICGFRAASHFYFGVDVGELTLSQTATLAAILPAPARYSPIHHPERARQQRDRVLRRMRTLGWNPSEIREALDEPVIAHGFELPEPRYPAYMQATRSWLEERLGTEQIYGLGLNVFTELDVAVQEQGDAALDEGIAFFTENLRRYDGNEAPLQTAAAVLDSETGLMVAVHGGDISLATDFNRATQALRQAGSSMKPLVYALAFSQLDEDGQPVWTAGDVVPNYRRTFEGTDGWRPRNTGGYSTTSSLAYALTLSQNIATASLLEALGGPRPMIDFADTLGFDTEAWREEMGLALGQAEVTPLEMSRFVSTILRGGRLASGDPVSFAIDIRGEPILEWTDEAPRVMSTDTAALTRDLMRLVIDSGTGNAIRGVAGRHGYYGPAIGKTGTTDSERDLWLVGGTARYSAGLWLGYDQPSRIGGSASDLAAPLWGWWALAIHQHYEDIELPGPENRRRRVCNVTGHRVNETCRGLYAPFLEGTQPRNLCSTEHPPEEPDDTPYQNLWERRRAAQQSATRSQEPESTLETEPETIEGPAEESTSKDGTRPIGEPG